MERKWDEQETNGGDKVALRYTAYIPGIWFEASPRYPFEWSPRMLTPLASDLFAPETLRSTPQRKSDVRFGDPAGKAPDRRGSARSRYGQTIPLEADLRFIFLQVSCSRGYVCSTTPSGSVQFAGLLCPQGTMPPGAPARRLLPSHMKLSRSFPSLCNTPSDSERLQSCHRLARTGPRTRSSPRRGHSPWGPLARGVGAQRISLASCQNEAGKAYTVLTAFAIRHNGRYNEGRSFPCCQRHPCR